MAAISESDLTTCAELVRRGDPERFMAAMAAPVAARSVLFALYAFNIEVARAPWASPEPMVAEMRLQWWRNLAEDIASGRPVAGHPVASALAAVVTPEMAGELDGFVAARRWDIYRDPFADEAEFDRYIDHTAGTLMWLAARSLGAAPCEEACEEACEAAREVVGDLAHASGVANMLRAVPELVARGRAPLPDASDDGIRALAGRALERLARARRRRRAVARAAAPALLAGWQAGPVLRQAWRAPARVGEGRLGQSEAGKRLSLMVRAATGRW